MVGGVIYVRGNVKDLSNEVWLMDLDENDKEFLLKGLPDFLDKIEKTELIKDLADMSSWKKIIAKTYEERNVRSFKPLKDFRANRWVKDGIFGDLLTEDYYVANFFEKDELRLKYPEWKNANYSAPCEYNCPIYIPHRKELRC